MGNVITRIHSCCCGGGVSAAVNEDSETAPLIATEEENLNNVITSPEIAARPDSEERWNRRALRMSQVRLYQRLQLSELLQEERHQLRKEELAALRARWRAAVAAGEARRPRGLLDFD